MSIAQLMFEELFSITNIMYNHQDNASFNDEWNYRGLSRYKDYYEERTKEIRR